MNNMFLRRINIRNRMFVFLIIGIVVFSGVLLLFAGYFSRMIVNSYLYDYLEKMHQGINKSIETTVDEINMLSIRILSDNNFYNLLVDKTLLHSQKSKKLNDLLNNFVQNREILAGIVIKTDDNETYKYESKNEITEEPEDTFMNEAKKSTKLMVASSVIKDKMGNAYIVLGRQFYNFNSGRSLGCLIIYIPELAIYDSYKGITSYKGYTFLISGDDYIISHPDKKKVGTIVYDSDLFRNNKAFIYYNSVIEGEKVIILSSILEERLIKLGVNWRIISVIYPKALFEITSNINLCVFIITIFISVTAIIISLRLSSKIVKPIELLKEKMMLFGSDSNIKLSLVKNEGDEIWELEKTYNDMITRIRELVNKNNEEKEKQREMELIALQAQINPHFLYNTLDAVGWMARIKKQEDIEKIVKLLAKFFRISLHKGDKFITVTEEIELILSFCEIENIRMPGKFELECNIEKEIEGCLILKIILQPMIENAIKHGIGPMKGKGHIQVNGYRKDTDIFFEVIDDGVGFDLGSYSVNETHGTLNHSGYGLRNVDERIKLEYGDSYGVKLSSQKNKGTRVVIKLRDIGYQ